FVPGYRERRPHHPRHERRRSTANGSRGDGRPPRPRDAGMIEVIRGTRDPSAVDRLLRSLPEWFGIESAIVEYVESAHRLDTYLAREPAADQPVGVLLAARHSQASGEIHLIAVDRARHRHGVGRS